MKRRTLLIGLVALLAPALATAEEVWRVVLARDVYLDYQKFLAGRDPLSLSHYGGPHARRDVVELVILQQALHRAGALRPLQFLLTDSEGRTLKMLRNGEADLGGTSAWQSRAAAHPRQLLTSRPLIPEGRFMAGLYFPAGHPALKTLAQDPRAVRRYTAVCAESWKEDLATLAALGSPVLRTENWTSMLGMLTKHRADYLLAPFQPTPGLRFEVGGMALEPAAGVKVSLAGSRHFLLWRQGRSARQLLQALDAGLAQLDAEGRIAQAYRESGFDAPAVRDWPVLNR